MGQRRIRQRQREQRRHQFKWRAHRGVVAERCDPSPVQRNRCAVLPLPRLHRRLPLALPQHSARGPCHDAALAGAAGGRHQPESLNQPPLQEARHKEKGAKIMKGMTRRKWLAAAGVTTAAVGANSLFAQEATPASTHHYDFKKISPRELIQRRHLPNVELITQDNQKVHFYTDLVKDRRVVIQFMFARCKDICPVITHHLAEVQRILKDRVGRDIFFYSITLSPEEDSPQDLKAFAKKHGVGPGWTFLTGKPDDILLLRKSLGFFYNDPKEDADRNNHSGMVVVGTEPLMRWAMCQGGARPEWIATVIRTEMDAPFKGAVNGIRQTDPAVRLNTKEATNGTAPAAHVHRMK